MGVDRRDLAAFNDKDSITADPTDAKFVYATWDRLVNDETIGTRPLLLLAVLLIVVGVQFFGLGLLGEFLVQESHRPKPEPARFLRRALGIGSGFDGSSRIAESGDGMTLAG